MAETTERSGKKDVVISGRLAGFKAWTLIEAQTQECTRPLTQRKAQSPAKIQYIHSYKTAINMTTGN